MANISILSRLISGVQRNVDLSTNTLVVSVIKVGGGSGTDLTKTILDNLVNLQNGTDFANGTNAHTHDGRYFTETELGSSTSSSGSDLIGDDATYSNFTPAAATVKGALSGIDTALATATASSALDGTFRIKNTADNTKQIATDASAITTGTTRTITMADANVNLADVNNSILKNGSRAFTANQSLGGFKLTSLAAGTGAGESVRYEQAILTSGANAFGANQSFGSFEATNLADPTSPQSAATKSYVDGVLDGRSWKNPVKVATTANITLSAPQTIDGIAVIAGDRVLVKDQTLGENNGIYIVAAGAWSRSSDANTGLELEGAAVFVAQGTVNHDFQFAQTADTITLGTTPLVWVVTSANSFSGHDMIAVVGGQISVDLATASGLESTNPGNAAGQLRVKLEASNPSLRFTGSNELALKFDSAGAVSSGVSGVAVQVDGSTIEISSNALRVKDAGITLAKLASNSVDENKIVSTAFDSAGAVVGGSGTKISVATDNSTIEKSANALRVKDAGITAAKLNTNVADQSSLTGGAGTALSVQSAPLVKRTLVAGEAFAADTTFAVRWALTGETAGRVYKADKDATSVNKYGAIGLARSVAGVAAAGAIDVVMLGEYSIGANDSAFASGDVGKELFVGTTGALIIGSALAGTTGEAAFCVGVIQTTTKVWVDQKTLRGIA